MNFGQRQQDLGFLSPSECLTLGYFFLLFILVDSEFGFMVLPSQYIVWHRKIVIISDVPPTVVGIPLL